MGFSITTPAMIAAQQAKRDAEAAKQAKLAPLTQQIMGSSDTSKWSGQGYGSAEANARAMADILSGIGITDIKQFGKVPELKKLEIGGYTYNGKPAQESGGRMFVWSDRPTNVDGDGNATYDRVYLNPEQAAQVKPVYGTYSTSYQYISDEQAIPTTDFTPVDQSKVVMNGGVPSIPTGNFTYGNKQTGQTVPNTYSERQTGTAWGGTFEGSGNTGFRVQFDSQGNPVFYTTGASSNDLANMFADSPLLGAVANVAAATFGGPVGVAALQAAQGKDVEDILKAAALTYAGQGIGNAVTSGLTDTLGSTAANVLGNVAKTEVASGGKADPVQALITGGIGAGTSAVLGEIPGFDNLDSGVQKAITQVVSSTLANGGDLTPQALVNAAITAGKSALAGGPNKADFETGYFAPGGAGYFDPAVDASIAPTPDTLGPSPSNQEILDAIGYVPEETPRPVYNIGDESVFDPGTTYNAGDEHVFDPGTTYNAGDEHVFDPGTTYNAEEDVPEMVITGDRPEPEPEPGFETWQPLPDDSEPGFETWQPTTGGGTTTTGGGTTTTGGGTTTTGGGTTTTGGGTTTPTKPAAPAAGGMDMASLLGLLGMLGSGQSAAAPVQTPLADIKSFEEQFGDLFGTTLGPNPRTAKAAHGGSVDELLQILRG